MKNKHLVSSLDIPQVKDMNIWANPNDQVSSGWIHFPYDYHDYQNIDGAHHFRIWLNLDEKGYYPIGQKYKLGKAVNKGDDSPSYTNGGIEYYATLRQAFKAGVEWCKKDPQFLIKDKQHQSKKQEVA